MKIRHLVIRLTFYRVGLMDLVLLSQGSNQITVITKNDGGNDLSYQHYLKICRYFELRAFSYDYFIVHQTHLVTHHWKWLWDINVQYVTWHAKKYYEVNFESGYIHSKFEA